MTVVESLPARPLEECEVASLNRSDRLELAIATAESGPTPGVVIATEGWVKGLAFDDEAGWRVVESVGLDEAERFEALRDCEAAIREALNAE